MNEESADPGPPRYLPPPPMQYPPPGDPVYPSSGYQSAAYPYAPAPPPYTGYPMPSDYGRPGTVTGAAVLAFVVAGLLFFAGLLLFSGASMVHGLGNDLKTDTTSITAELVVDGFVNLVLGGLLVAGGVGLMGGRQYGRTMLFIATALVVCDTVYWLARVDLTGVGLILSLGLFAIPAVIAAALAGGSAASNWMSRER